MTDTVELRLRAAIDAAPSGILMTDAEGRIVLVNRQIESMFDYPREELLGKSVDMLVPERLRGAHTQDRAAFLREARVRSMGAGRDLHGLRKDGSEFPIEIGLTPLATDSGMFVLSTVVDISARKRAEERFRIAVESSPSGMIMIDGDGRIVLVNREIERMFGHAREEILGRPVETLVPLRYREAHPRHRDAFRGNPQARSMGVGRELFGLRKDGVEIPIEIGLNPIETEEGMVVLASVVDIGARKRAEQDRRRLEDQLRQAQKMEAIGRLAGGIAHDFNNLLMGVIGCADQLRRTLPPGHEALSTVLDISDAARRGASLTRDLLDFSSHRKPVDAEPSDVNAVVRVAERMLRQVIGEDIVLEVELAESLGPVLANPTHLEHILLNLAVNSRDAMPNGGRLRIATRSRRLDQPLATRGRTLADGEYVLLEVEDSGWGMDASTQAKVFEPFFTTKPIGSGTGLGLYTVYSMVEQLGGGIDFESEQGRGTSFRIYFPLHRASLEARTIVPAPATEISIVPGSARILLVEDERLIRATLRLELIALGYDVLVAENGKRAIEVSRSCEDPIDLLLSDIVMPDASGTDVARILKEERPSIRVLFMSAYPADLLVQQGRIQPGTKTLEKPFDGKALAVAVQEILSRSESTARTSG